ncbi:MAG: pseudouridine synthase [Pseudomonadota bacterium]
MPTKIRLQRMIALSSELSRRSAEAAIKRGEVTVNGRVTTELGTSVDPLRDKVCLNGSPLFFKARRNYLAFFKPRNVLVTKHDPQSRPTIWDGLKEWKDKLNSVGRLDFDSDGLLLLTDDGDFLNLLTHPKHEIWKIYRVRVKGEPSAEDLKRLREGVKLSDGQTLPAKVKRVDKGGLNALLEISIREGRNRQVRRMCDAIGYPVIKLRRIAIGPIRLGSLKIGKWRHLKSAEVKAVLGHV